MKVMLTMPHALNVSRHNPKSNIPLSNWFRFAARARAVHLLYSHPKDAHLHVSIHLPENESPKVDAIPMIFAKVFFSLKQEENH
jgi:hypothetical protein